MLHINRIGRSGAMKKKVQGDELVTMENEAKLQHAFKKKLLPMSKEKMQKTPNWRHHS